MAFLAFASILVGTIVVSHALRSISTWKPIAAPLTALSWGALIPLLLLGHAHFRVNSLGGLYEKIFLAVELLWLLLVAAPMALEHGLTSPRVRPGTERSPAR